MDTEKRKRESESEDEDVNDDGEIDGNGFIKKGTGISKRKYNEDDDEDYSPDNDQDDEDDDEDAESFAASDEDILEDASTSSGGVGDDAAAASGVGRWFPAVGRNGLETQVYVGENDFDQFVEPVTPSVFTEGRKAERIRNLLALEGDGTTQFEGDEPRREVHVKEVDKMCGTETPAFGLIAKTFFGNKEDEDEHNAVFPHHCFVDKWGRLYIWSKKTALFLGDSDPDEVKKEVKTIVQGFIQRERDEQESYNEEFAETKEEIQVKHAKKQKPVSYAEPDALNVDPCVEDNSDRVYDHHRPRTLGKLHDRVGKKIDILIEEIISCVKVRQPNVSNRFLMMPGRRALDFDSKPPVYDVRNIYSVPFTYECAVDYLVEPDPERMAFIARFFETMFVTKEKKPDPVLRKTFVDTLYTKLLGYRLDNIVYMVGNGENGKSFLKRLMGVAFGEGIFTGGKREAFSDKNTRKSNPDMEPFLENRIVSIPDMAKGHDVTSVLKQISGYDPIYFKPSRYSDKTFKGYATALTMIDANPVGMPELKHEDGEQIKRRIRVFPFNNSFKDANQGRIDDDELLQYAPDFVHLVLT